MQIPVDPSAEVLFSGQATLFMQTPSEGEVICTILLCQAWDCTHSEKGRVVCIVVGHETRSYCVSAAETCYTQGRVLGRTAGLDEQRQGQINIEAA